MAVTIEDIEDGFIAAFEPLRTSIGVRDIKSYQAELATEEEIGRAIRILPAILVVYGGSVFEEHGSRKLEKLRFLVFVCDKNLRGEAGARRGSTENPGTYAMLAAVRDAVVGQQFGLEIHPVKLGPANAVYLGKGVSIYAAEYWTAYGHLYTGG